MYLEEIAMVGEGRRLGEQDEAGHRSAEGQAKEHGKVSKSTRSNNALNEKEGGCNYQRNTGVFNFVKQTEDGVG